jgi:hypothetical protein
MADRQRRLIAADWKTTIAENGCTYPKLAFRSRNEALDKQRFSPFEGIHRC